MAIVHRPLFLLLLLLLLLSSPPRSSALIKLGQLSTLLSLSHSLLSRVATARAARGDLAGADRARKIADKLRLLGGGSIWSVGWDFARNYAWSGAAAIPTAEISRSAAEFVAAVAEVARLDSGAARAKWGRRKYARLRTLANSLLRSLLEAFSRPGPLREMVLVVQKEVVEGELLKDCLEIGAADLEGVVRIARELFFSSMDAGDTEL